MKSVHIHTLGCRVNQYDSQVLRELGERAGYTWVDDPARASLVVLVSCTVTAAADTSVRRLIRRFRRLNPQATIALVGCLPSRVQDLPADLVLGNRDKFRVFERLEDQDKASPRRREGTKEGGNTRNVHWPIPISSFAGHRRPILKVQDGCGFACSFCAVPGVRGGSLSRPRAEILEEARILAGKGARELVLAGVQLSSYGLDLGLKADAPRLAPLVEALLKVPGVKRVRLSSYGVAGFEAGLLSLVGEEDGLCPHFHLPLQSGDEGILRAMKRPYSLVGFRRVVDAIRRSISRAGLTTDVIAGFPGETPEAFRNTLDRIRELGFRDLHAFPYSERPGTEATGIEPKVPVGVVRERIAELLTLKREIVEASAREAEGEIRWVVEEDHSPGYSGGTTAEGLRVIFQGKGGKPGGESRVRLGKIRKGQIQAVRVE